MESSAKRAVAQTELDQLTAFIFRWRWLLTAMVALVNAPDAYSLYEKRLEFLKAVMTGSMMTGTFYQAFGQHILAVITFLLITFNIRQEVNRHRYLLAQEEMNRAVASSEAWPPAPRI